MPTWRSEPPGPRITDDPAYDYEAELAVDEHIDHRGEADVAAQWGGWDPDPMDFDPLLDREPMGGDPYWSEDRW